MNEQMRQRLMELMLETGAFSFGTFTLVSGRLSNYYCNMRVITNHPEGGSLVGQLLLQLMEDLNLKPDSIGGLETGALPVGSHIQAAAYYLFQRQIRTFYSKKKPKEHGLKTQVEGCCDPNDQVIILEDVTTTGGSALTAIEAVEALGVKVLAAFSILDRQEGAAEAFKARNIPFYSIFTAKEFLDKKKD